MQSIKINTSGAMQSLHGKLFLSFFKLIDYFLRNPFGPMQLYLPICSTPVAYYSFFCTDIIMPNWSLIKVSFKCITLIKVSFKRTLLSSSKAAAYYFFFFCFLSYHILFQDTITQAGMVLLHHGPPAVGWAAQHPEPAQLGSLPLWVKPALAQSYFLSKHHNPHVLLALTTSPIQIIT